MALIKYGIDYGQKIAIECGLFVYTLCVHHRSLIIRNSLVDFNKLENVCIHIKVNSLHAIYTLFTI